MYEMTARASPPAHDPQFDGFLFAEVGEDRNGMRVSVLSALARLGVDPWQEARELAGLPEDSARERLDALIAKLPGVPSLILDHRAIAERLVALLPRFARVLRAPTGKPAAADDTAARTHEFAFVIFVILMLVGLALGPDQEPSAEAGGAGAPISESAAADR